MKLIHVIGGGTVVHVRPHFAVTAPAYGGLARFIAEAADREATRLWGKTNTAVIPCLTKMAGGKKVETNDDLRAYLDDIVSIKDHKQIVFLTAAVCDWEPAGLDGSRDFGKQAPRLKTADGGVCLTLTPAEKLIGRIRGKDAPNPRKDIFLVACKTTTGATRDEMFLAGLDLMKRSSANLVLVNDIQKRLNIIVTPEQAQYTSAEGPEDRWGTVKLLVKMALARAEGTFTRSTVVEGEPVPWDGAEVHSTLRTVVDHCIAGGAYKDLLGRNATVGHFAQKVGDDVFLTSRRKSNFNKMAEVGLVKVTADGDDRVIAEGSKPSVGGQSQRAIFRDHPDTDCIVHAHVPLRPGAGEGTDGYGPIGRAPQWMNECGSHQCGENTSANLREVAPGIKAVYLEKHGPNVVFHHTVSPQEIIRYLDATFDLSRHTGESAVD